MRLAALALHDPADELDGTWPREQLEAMNEHFSAALNRAFELGLESRKSAASQVALPRAVAPGCRHRYVRPHGKPYSVPQRAPAW